MPFFTFIWGAGAAVGCSVDGCAVEDCAVRNVAESNERERMARRCMWRSVCNRKLALFSQDGI